MRTATFAFNGEKIIIKSYKGVQKKHWGVMKYKHRVSLSYREDSISFSFFDNDVETSELLNIVDACVTDGLAGAMDFFDYANEFGYGDEEIGEARSDHKGCQMIRAKLHYVGLSDNELIELGNLLRESRIQLKQDNLAEASCRN